MEVAVVADEVLGTDGRFGIHRVRAEVLDGEGHVRAVRIDDSAAESAADVRLVVHSETVPAGSDGAAVRVEPFALPPLVLVQQQRRGVRRDRRAGLRAGRG